MLQRTQTCDFTIKGFYTSCEEYTLKACEMGKSSVRRIIPGCDFRKIIYVIDINYAIFILVSSHIRYLKKE